MSENYERQGYDPRWLTLAGSGQQYPYKSVAWQSQLMQQSRDRAFDTQANKGLAKLIVWFTGGAILLFILAFVLAFMGVGALSILVSFGLSITAFVLACVLVAKL